MFNNISPPPSEIRVVYELMCRNMVVPDGPQTIWRMRIACWIRKATNTHSQYVITIAFPLQQWLHERPSVLRYTYITCLVRRSVYSAVQNEYLNYNTG